MIVMRNAVFDLIILMALMGRCLARALRLLVDIREFMVMAVTYHNRRMSTMSLPDRG